MTEEERGLDTTLHILGAIAYQDTDPDRALEHAEKALEMSPTPTHARIARRQFARLKYKSGDFQEAEQLHQEIIENHPDDPSGYTDYGRFLERIGRFDDAIAQYNRARELDPKALETPDDLATIKELMGDWEGAEALWKQKIELADDRAAHFGYALHLLARGRIEEGLGQAERLLELEPDDPLAYSGHFSSRSEGVTVETTVEVTPKDDRSLYVIYYHTGVILLLAHRYEAAVANLERAIEIHSKGVVPELGESYLGNGAYDQALRALAKAEENVPEEDLHLRSRIATVQGLVHARTGQREKARGKLEELLQTPKFMDDRAYMIAALYLGLGDMDPGFEWLNQAYEERGRNGAIRLIKATPHFSDEVRADPRFQAVVKKLGLGP